MALVARMTWSGSRNLHIAGITFYTRYMPDEGPTYQPWRLRAFFAGPASVDSWYVSEASAIKAAELCANVVIAARLADQPKARAS